MNQQPYFLFDVDGCVLDYSARKIDEVQELLDGLELLGYKIVFWSGGGKRWAESAARKYGLDGIECYRKPEYPIKLSDALALLKYPPVLQLDDDETEAVEGWDFLCTPCHSPDAFNRIIP